RSLAGAYAMVENLDHNIGRIRKALDRLGLTDSTHLLFFSDHGDMHGSHGQIHKTSPFEESIRVPFLISGGSTHYGVGAGMRTDCPVNHVDIAPTSLGLCGLPVPEWMEGFDYSGLRLRRDDSGPDSAYIQSVIPTRHAHSVDRAWRGLVTRDGWKYVCLERTPWLLFNLNEDPYEWANMALNTAYDGVRKRLHDRLRAWIADTEDAFDLPEI
ncbi:MAG TPA: sulfatase-like hydrolase/transferase, partial [Clostridia bacterium]|nr:sulfatase-like hydrolase/transferase [Clostridia bacterium]